VRIGIKGTISSKGRVYACSICFGAALVLPLLYTTFGMASKYLLGLINSRLLSVWFSAMFDKLQRNIFPQFKVKELASFPIRPINFDTMNDKVLHDQLVVLVEQMLTLNKQYFSSKTNQDKIGIQRQINVIDKYIDHVVYKLYGLTEEDIAIVENPVI
jgi:adenine-specific DNA-methyltransferase